MKTTKDVLKWVIFIGLFVIPFIAFIHPMSMFFPFITGKGFTFRILIEVLFGLFVVLAAIAPEYRPKLSPLTKAVLIFTGVILVADIFGVNPYKSLWSNYERMEGFVLVIHLLFYYIVASSVFRTKERWIQFFNVSIVASVIMSIYGVLQLWGKIAIDQGGVRLDGSFGNATYLAIYLVFHIFLCLYLLLNQSLAKWQKWTYGCIAVFEAWVLYFTATRGAILGLIGGLFLAALLMAWKERENLRLRKLGRNAIIALVVFVALFALVRNTSFVQKSPVLSRFASLGISEFEGEGRYYVWPMAVKGFLQSPKTVIIGWGQEGFNYVFNKNYDPRMYGQEDWFDRTHDIVLDWLIAGGLLGLLAYASMYVALLYLVWRSESPLSVAEKSVFTGMIAAYIFHNLFVFDNLLSYIMFFALLSYIHAVSVEEKMVSGSFQTKTFSTSTVLYVISPIVLVLTGICIYFVNIPALEANMTLIQAIENQSGGLAQNVALFKQAYSYNSFGSTEATEQLMSVADQVAQATSLSSADKQAFYDFASAKIIAKVNETPHDARYLVFAGRFFNEFGQYDNAITYLQRALVESPKKESIIYELGSVYIGKKDYATMFKYFKQAYDEDPSSPEGQVIYAIGAIYTRNTAVLQQMSAVISTQTVLSDNRFLRAYADIGDYGSVEKIILARIQQNPNDMQSKLSLASVYVIEGQKQKAIDVINAMIAQDPSFKTQGQQYIKQIQGQ